MVANNFPNSSRNQLLGRFLNGFPFFQKAAALQQLDSLLGGREEQLGGAAADKASLNHLHKQIEVLQKQVTAYF